jgi:hypothetical protein
MEEAKATERLRNLGERRDSRHAGRVADYSCSEALSRCSAPAAGV